MTNIRQNLVNAIKIYYKRGYLSWQQGNGIQGRVINAANGISQERTEYLREYNTGNEEYVSNHHEKED